MCWRTNLRNYSGSFLARSNARKGEPLSTLYPVCTCHRDVFLSTLMCFSVQQRGMDTHPASFLPRVFKDQFLEIGMVTAISSGGNGMRSHGQISKGYHSSTLF